MTAPQPETNSPISRDLLAWYDRHARDLPWRAPPGAALPDPYRVWLSEIMLQQTTVAAVRPYFAKFTRTWPTVEALAAASDDEIMAAWAGLGYYSRARNLVKCARIVAERGGFPESEAELRLLPGVGNYTAAAIAAIAFGKRAVVVDANVERVVSRLFAIEQALPSSRPAIAHHADEITPDDRAGDFAQAMMDLGSTICTARDARCLLCPIAPHCAGRKSGDPVQFPRRLPKAVKPERRGRAYWIERSGMVWLVRRENRGMLGGMMALPDDGWTARADGSGTAPIVGEWDSVGAVRHVFTHAALTLEVWRTTVTDAPSGDGEWWPVERIGDAGLPNLFVKAARLAIA